MQYINTHVQGVSEQSELIPWKRLTWGFIKWKFTPYSFADDFLHVIVVTHRQFKGIGLSLRIIYTACQYYSTSLCIPPMKVLMCSYLQWHAGNNLSELQIN